MNILKIYAANGDLHDYSRYIQRRGLGWERNDVDSEKTVRVKTGNLRRNKITTKRKCAYTLMPMSQELTAQLDTDLQQDTFRAIYSDLHGTYTRYFYCSAFSATLAEVDGDTECWEDATFNMIEV